MDLTRVRLAAIAVAMILAAPAATAAPPPPTTLTPQAGRLKDGSSLILIKIPGARETSLRFVVGSGALKDPEGKAGLAHLVEHLVFQGSYETRSVALSHAVHEAGGSVNAFTMAGATMYVLDAPRLAFRTLAARYLRTVTNPALTLSNLGSELGVVQAESEMRPSEHSIRSQIDFLLYPSLDQTSSILGTAASRKEIRRGDITDYFAKHYVPSNTWAVVVGDLDFEEASQLVEDNSCLPPEPIAPLAEPVSVKPRLPIEIKTRSLLTVAVFGYVLQGGTPQECQTLAALLERRLKNELIVKDPLVSAIEVSCPRYRGVAVVEAIGVSTTTGLEVSRVPDVIESHFASLVKTPPSREEIQGAAKHREALRLKIAQSPAALAEAAALEIVQGERDPSRILDWVLPVGTASAAACQSLAEKSFKDDNKISILFSPYQGDY